MAYVALYRRWRPQGFDALVGQDAVRIALSNALTTGRIAHAYLFAGPRGTGKTSFGYDYYIQPTSPKSTYTKKGRFDDELICA